MHIEEEEEEEKEEEEEEEEGGARNGSICNIWHNGICQIHVYGKSIFEMLGSILCLQNVDNQWIHFYSLANNQRILRATVTASCYCVLPRKQHL